jgi:hypothetical protein
MKINVGSDSLLNRNDVLFPRGSHCSEILQEHGACGLKVSAGLSVTLPIDVCHCDIRELMLLRGILYELAVTSSGTQFSAVLTRKVSLFENQVTTSPWK